MEITSHEDLLVKYYGEKGTEKRNKYENIIQGLRLSEMRKYCTLSVNQVKALWNRKGAWLYRIEAGIESNPEDIKALKEFYAAYLVKKAEEWLQDSSAPQVSAVQ